MNSFPLHISAPQERHGVRFAFLGDLALNDAFVNASNREEMPDVLGNLLPYVCSVDLLFANWEMAMSGERQNILKSPRVITTPLAAKAALQLPLTAVSLANNHVYDCCEDGFLATIDFLRSNGIRYVGAGMTRDEARQPLHLRVRDLNVCVLAYVAEQTNPRLPHDARVFLNWFNLENAQHDIGMCRAQCDLLVVSVHWSANADYFPYAAPAHRSLGRRLVKMGAHVVLGGHPHQLQGYEYFRGALVVYSLGNTVFSDFCNSQPVQRFPPSTRTAGLLLVDYHLGQLSSFLTVTRQHGLQVKVIKPSLFVRSRNWLLSCPLVFYYLVWWTLRVMLFLPKKIFDRPFRVSGR